MENRPTPHASFPIFRSILRVAHCTLWFLHGAFAMAAADCLFENARSDWRISLREDADPAEVFAAETLQTNIVKISGALLPIVRENTPAAPKALVVSPFLPKGPDDLVSIRTDGGCILLEGNSPRATIYASCRFLQDQLGARWYWPGEDGERECIPDEWAAKTREFCLGDLKGRGIEAYRPSSPRTADEYRRILTAARDVSAKVF